MEEKKQKEKLIIFDTTLRDGEQSPGCRMDVNSKLLIARQLAELGVDVIEAGFPISSPGEFDAVLQISREVRGPRICALARTREKDIVEAVAALNAARNPRIHVFVATSDVHMEKKLCKSSQEVIEMVGEYVCFAKKYIDDVQFSPEDAARTGIEFLRAVIEVAVAEGATTINIPDTVGYSVGREFPDIIGEVKNLLKLESREAVISVHCHNDLGLAVSNTLAGIQAGARQAECCVMGLGERAGNAQLEAVVMAVKTRQDQFSVYTDIDTTKLFKTATLVSFVIGKPISDTLSIVGKNAFSHGAGIHQHGVTKDSLTYEIMKPETVGWEGDSLPLVKHSGRKALEERLSVIGYRLSAEDLNYFFEKFKLLADHKSCVYNEDLHLLMQECFVERMADSDKLIKCNRVDYHRVDNALSATVVLSQKNNLFEASGNGDGAIASVGNAILKALEGPSFQLGNIRIKRFNTSKSGGGIEAIGLVNIEIENDKGVAYGRGSDTDVIVAFAKAMISAINHLMQTPIQENNNDS